MDYIRVPQLLILSGLSHKRPKETVWQAKTGMRLKSHGQAGLPYGRARAILLYLAHHSAGSGGRVSGSLDDIRAMFNDKWRTENLEQHFRRLLECEYQQVTAACLCGERDCRSVKSLDVIRAVRYCARSTAFEIELGDAFGAGECDAFLCPMEPVRTLVGAGQLQTLDLYLWYQWKLARQDHATVDAFGPDGPFGVAPIARDRSRQRSLLAELHEVILAFWPECPFHIVGTRAKRRIIHAPGGRVQLPCAGLEALDALAVACRASMAR